MIDYEEAVRRFVAVHHEVGMTLDDVEIEVLPRPHRPRDLPSGRMAIYTFIMGTTVLKVGKAGPRSGARYRYQHYNGCASSTLAGSLITYGELVGACGLQKENVREWIYSQTDRINLLLPQQLGDRILSELEAYLHARWSPVFEGRLAI